VITSNSPQPHFVLDSGTSGEDIGAFEQNKSIGRTNPPSPAVRIPAQRIALVTCDKESKKELLRFAFYSL
jgi:hypothetical protein